MKILQVFVLIFGLAVFVNAQKAILTGTVFYAEKFKVENAKIQAVSENGELFETKTNIDGFYRMKLPPGSYKIIFQHCSIENESHTLSLRKGQKFRLDSKQSPSIVDGCGMNDEILIQNSVKKISKKVIKRKKIIKQ